jgi:phosphate transport system substrate-binding protein
MKKISIVALAIAMFLSIFAGAAQASSKLTGKVTVNGSSALLPLMLQAKKEFNRKFPRVKVSVAGSASIVGPQSAKKGVATIGTCDWDASTDVPGFKKFDGLVAHKVAAIPFATVVHKDNPVTNLTRQQLVDIFQGKITNWKEVGGKDATIIVVNRAFGSGTRVNYQAKALGGASFMTKGDNYKEVKSTGEMVTNIGNTPNSIGYMDLVYVKGNIKAISYNGVAPTVANVIAKKYPVWGFGYMMTKGQPTGATKEFIKFVQSASFQNGAVKTMKFIPISAIK